MRLVEIISQVLVLIVFYVQFYRTNLLLNDFQEKLRFKDF